MKNKIIPGLQFILVVNALGRYCHWCGTGLRQCGMCKGSGLFRGSTCEPCKGHGCICPTHLGDWDK